MTQTNASTGTFARDNTPFLVYESGTAYIIPNSICSAADHVISLFDREGLDEGSEQLRREAAAVGHSLRGTDLNNLWLKYFELFLIPQGQDTPPLAARVEMLKLMRQPPPREGWEQLRRYLIEHADVLTGWHSSFQRVLAERDHVFRGDDGLYYRRGEDGDLYRVIGATTLRETHLDFVTDQALRTYGNLRLPIEMFSLFAISGDFDENPKDYPKSMKAVLTEPRWQMTQHRWSLQHWDRSRTVKWRPHSNFCDPEWLVGDLLGHLTDTLKIDAWQERVRKRMEQPLPFPGSFDRQMDCVLDCHLRIGDEDETSFEFSGRPYRWINGSLESDTIVSVALKKDEDSVCAEEDLNRLLTFLAWEHRTPISRKVGSTVLGAKRALPWIAGTRSAMGLLLRPEWLFRNDPALIGQRKWLAMALYREGLNSRSVFYEFLNFWKAIEVALPSVPTRRTWIDASVTKLHLEQKRISEIQATESSMADYLYSDSRCAIAHVNHQPFVDPDSAEDYHRLSRDARIIKDLARMAIESMA